jgi:hypothetical protein
VNKQDGEIDKVKVWQYMPKTGRQAPRERHQKITEII